MVLVILALARDARGDNLDFNIYDERHCKAIAYLYLCDTGSVSDSHTPRMYADVCKIRDADWQMLRNAEKMQVF
jgi:hypothetical protein